MKKIVFIFLIQFICLKGQSLWNGQGHIPQDYQLDWFNSGLLNNYTLTADIIFDVTDPVFGADPADNTFDDFPAIQAAIYAARNYEGLVIIYFPTGTYNIFSRIELMEQDSNLVFQGNGSDQTILKFEVGSGTQCFYIHGTKSETTHYLDQDIPKGSNLIYGSTLNSLNSGDWIRFSEFDYPVHSGWAIGTVGQISKIVNQTGNEATIKDIASKEYSNSFNLTLWKILPIKNVGFEKIQIYRGDNGDSDIGSNIMFEYAVNCWIKGVESYKTCRHHVDIWYSSHIEVSGNYFHDANSHGDEGRGYGVIINFSSTNCLIENNIFRKLRHAMAVQAGANSNVFTYNYSTEQDWNYSNKGPDLCLHGNYPYSNLFESNWVEKIEADNTHGWNGPYNTFVRNMATKEPIAYLRKMKKWSILGSMWINNENIAYPLRLRWDHSSPVDLYGVENSYTNAVAHNPAYDGPGYSHYKLDDISYYYSAAPEFLNGYSWPSIGPKTQTQGEISYNIPAKDRFSNSLKTYLTEKTQWPTPRLAPTIRNVFSSSGSTTFELTNNGYCNNMQWTASHNVP